MCEKVRFYAEMPIIGLKRCDIFENPDDLDGMRCRANRRRKKNTACHAGEYQEDWWLGEPMFEYLSMSERRFPLLLPFEVPSQGSCTLIVVGISYLFLIVPISVHLDSDSIEFDGFKVVEFLILRNYYFDHYPNVAKSLY